MQFGFCAKSVTICFPKANPDPWLINPTLFASACPPYILVTEVGIRLSVRVYIRDFKGAQCTWDSQIEDCVEQGCFRALQTFRI